MTKRLRDALIVSAYLAAWCGAAVWAVSLAGCQDERAPVAYGMSARSAQLRMLRTPSGLVVRLPGWLRDADEKIALAEVEAGVWAYSEAWGGGGLPVVPASVTVYPLGWVAFPADDYAGLVSGIVDAEGNVTVAWTGGRQRPQLIALGHELGHVAAPDASETEVMGGERFVRAEMACMRAQVAAK